MPPGRRDEFLNGSRRHILAEFTAAVDRAILDERDSGIRVVAHPVRGVQIDYLEGTGQSAVAATEWWGILRLTDDEARQLRDELESVVRRYDHDTPGPGKHDYISMFGLVPKGVRRRRR
jgi:hypothetical protein